MKEKRDEKIETSVGDLVYRSQEGGEEHIVVRFKDGVHLTLEGAREQMEVVSELSNGDFLPLLIDANNVVDRLQDKEANRWLMSKEVFTEYISCCGLIDTTKGPTATRLIGWLVGVMETLSIMPPIAVVQTAEEAYLFFKKHRERYSMIYGLDDQSMLILNQYVSQVPIAQACESLGISRQSYTDKRRALFGKLGTKKIIKIFTMLGKTFTFKDLENDFGKDT